MAPKPSQRSSGLTSAQEKAITAANNLAGKIDGLTVEVSRQGKYGLRNRIIAVLALVGVLGCAYLWRQGEHADRKLKRQQTQLAAQQAQLAKIASEAALARRVLVSQCIGGNLSRADQRALWLGVVELSKRSGSSSSRNLTPEQRQRQETEFLRLLDGFTKQRDCNKEDPFAPETTTMTTPR